MSGLATPAAGDIMSMSDEDILNLSAPPSTGADDVPVVEDGEDDAGVEQNGDEASGSKALESEADDSDTTGQDDGMGADDQPGGVADTTEGEPAKEPVKEETPAAVDPEAGDTQDTKDGEKTEDKATEATDQVFSIPATIKANGKDIVLKSEAEAVQLMQMGANYTRKMQQIAPHRKALLMLENNGLLDEGKLSFLIDLERKNPEAIKKLIKDAGIDPMDIDTSTDPDYLEGNHRVTDEEAAFRDTLTELTSNETGSATVKLINDTWDHASKEVLWASPQIMSVIHEQRESGVYDLIVTEMDRQRTLGHIAPNIPFLQAYKTVGDQLVGGSNGQAPAVQTPGNPTGQSAPVVVATRTAAPKSPVANGDKAGAASSTRSAPRQVEKASNPLAMSDEEFAKLDQFAGRL